MLNRSALFSRRLLIGFLTIVSTITQGAEPSTADLPDLTDLSLEELSQTEVISTAHFAQQVVDAPSAVSVVTADDIARFGYRTIGEILDSMRGIHITRDRDYDFLGGRGYGAPGEYAGRIKLLIDGYSAADNYYNQIFTGNEGYLDTSLIERVEYAPGPGSAIYGNNAFLGVINIITRRGRDIDGTVVDVTGGSQQDREGTITWGKRFSNGAEWLLSASYQQNDGIQHYYNDDPDHSPENSSKHLFLKGSLGHWSVEAASAEGWRKFDFDAPDTDNFRIEDRNRFINISYESDLDRNWRTITRLYHGEYRYTASENYVTFDEQDFFRTLGRWYGVDGKLIYLGLEGHRILLGSEYHIDSHADASEYYYASGDLTDAYTYRDNADTLSFYVEDSLDLTPTLSASIGGRYDKRRYLSLHSRQHSISPRLALIYIPRNDLTVKLSYGQANRFAAIFDIYGEIPKPSRVRTSELVVEHKKDDYRLLSSLYHYRVDRPDEFSDSKYQDITGAELESEWQWPGGQTLRASLTWQQAQDDSGNDMPNVPRTIGKLQYSLPLAEEKLRASLALRYTGTRAKLSNEGYADSYSITDLTLTSSNTLPNTKLTFAVRNLFDTHYGEVAYTSNDSGLQAQVGRTFWLQAEYIFQ
ncbi:TonB-dependent receptor plug domain-containing protein [Amphritea pacifica]|uniref:TonB-dependent receptor plug domain-containing protein n=1 Tax=Amphritea pacifica TaxID=2811233 RepID=UPI0019663283|nr:TonB-dependent receptor [Amphritea pacifica]MBN1007643.1 TonB-dependent receptor [Amphritea pacifica]